VPVVAYKSEPHATFRIGERTIELKSPSEIVAWSYQRKPEVRVDGSELIFVGYGVIAPEYGWNDYKSQELRGKTLVVLINDPCWLQIQSAGGASGAPLVKRYAGSRDGAHRARGLRGRGHSSRVDVESAAGA
jgi:hypothetical protein